MGYFNYFIKCFIRLFTKKYFKFILIFTISFVLFFILNNNIVRAESSPYSLNLDYFNETDISTARSLVGESIWNNEDYDIFLSYSNSFNSKCVTYFNSKDFFDTYSDELNYKIVYSFTSGGSTRVYAVTLRNYNNADVTVTGFTQNTIALYNNRTATRTNNFFLETLLSNNMFLVYPIRTHYDIVDGDNKLISFSSDTFPVAPYFITTDNELTTFDFDYLQISGGNTKYVTNFLGQEYKAQLNLKYIYNGVTTNIEIIDDYINYNSSNNTWQINIPYNALTNSVVVRNGGNFRFVLDYRLQNETGYSITTNDLVYNLTTEQEENINAESNKQLQDAILNTGQQTNNNLNNINNNLTNSNVDNLSQNSLPQDTTSDITSDGVNGIFQSIYNAFCVGQPQDIVFPFPFTQKNITLSPSYVRNALEGSGAGFIIIIIQAFWWYLISRFIIKDIMGKINNIKSGNIENIEKTNIRGDML